MPFDRNTRISDLAGQFHSRRSLINGSLKMAGAASVAAAATKFNGSTIMAHAQQSTPGTASPASSTQVDPQMQKVLDALASFSNPPIEDVTPDVARNLPGFPNAISVVEMQQGVVSPPKVAITGVAVPGPEGDIACRVYKPIDNAEGAMLPVVVYFHGGGFVIANLDSYERSCVAIADLAKCMVVSVAYRQAPEHQFTAAVDDAYAVTQYLLSNAGEFGGDASKVAVLGESAGGNLATVVCLKAKDEGGMMPIHQVLVYPITTYAPEGDQTQSIEQFKDASPLNAAMLDWFKGYYLTDNADAQNAYSSPLLAPDLSGLPPTTMIQAEIDPLQSQGTAYADALKKAGNDVNATIYRGVTHEFFGMGSVVEKAMQAENDAARALMTAFEGSAATPVATPGATPIA